MRLAQRRLPGAEPLGRDVGRRLGVLGRDDRHVRVGVARSRAARCRTTFVEQLHRRVADERRRRSASNPRRTSAREPRRASSRATSSISGRPGGCERTSTCQPGCGVDAVDEHACVRLDPRVHRRDPSRAVASPSRAPTTASAARALGGWPVTASRNSSRPSACSWASVSASTVAVRGTSRRSAISPNESPGPSSPRRRAVHRYACRRPGFDDVEPVAVIALVDDRGARLRRNGLELRRQALERWRRQRREDRYLPQQLEVVGHPCLCVDPDQLPPGERSQDGKDGSRDDQRPAASDQVDQQGVSAAPSPIVPTRIICSTPNTRASTSGGAVRWSRVRPATSTSVLPSPCTARATSATQL